MAQTVATTLKETVMVNVSGMAIHALPVTTETAGISIIAAVARGTIANGTIAGWNAASPLTPLSGAAITTEIATSAKMRAARGSTVAAF